MAGDSSPTWIYNQTVKMFAAGAAPAFEDAGELEAHWGRAWGVDNDVGRMRAVLVHRPGPEMDVIDPSKRIESIGSYGDVEAGWYFQSDSLPKISEMQAQHDALVAALRAEGVEVYEVEGVTGGRLKSCYTRDPLIMVKGGAIVCRMGRASAAGRSSPSPGPWRASASRSCAPCRSSSHGGRQLRLDQQPHRGHRLRRAGESGGGRPDRRVLQRQGVELIVIDLVGYDIHIDGSFLMVDRDLALIDPTGLPYSFIERLKALGVRTIEIEPADNDGSSTPGRGASNFIMPRAGPTGRSMPWPSRGSPGRFSPMAKSS